PDAVATSPMSFASFAVLPLCACFPTWAMVRAVTSAVLLNFSNAAVPFCACSVMAPLVLESSSRTPAMASRAAFMPAIRSSPRPSNWIGIDIGLLQCSLYAGLVDLYVAEELQYLCPIPGFHVGLGSVGHCPQQLVMGSLDLFDAGGSLRTGF